MINGNLSPILHHLATVHPRQTTTAFEFLWTQKLEIASVRQKLPKIHWT